MIFHKGQRVNTPMGPGSVAYQTMEPPDYREVLSVSVILDSRRDNDNYSGTIFSAKKVTAED